MSTKKRFSLTLFTYDPRMKIRESTPSEARRGPELSRTRAVGEKAILKIFAEYGFLNLNMVQRCLDMRGHYRIDAKKSVEKMMRLGKLKRHTISLKGSGKQDIDIYSLTSPMIEDMRRAGVPLIRYRQDMTDIPYILEHLSVAQWHISLLEESVIHESAYMLRIALKDGRSTVIPSLTSHTTIMGQKLYLCGVALPKGGTKEDMARFLKNIFIMDSYFKEEHMTYRSYVFVLIGEDDRQAEEACRYLSGIKETSGIYFLNTNDSITSASVSSPLSLLYDISLKKGVIERSVISIPRTSIEALRNTRHKN